LEEWAFALLRRPVKGPKIAAGQAAAGSAHGGAIMAPGPIAVSFFSTHLHRTLGIVFALALSLCGQRTARAQADAPPPDVANAKFSAEGLITMPTFVKAGPGDNFYPTMKLEKGSTVVVVGTKGSWLKIEPPKGSFSYVPKAYVQRHGDGNKAKVSGSLNVRAGSALQPAQWAMQCKMEVGQDVTILGEESEFFKIEPPPGAYLYVNDSAIKAVRVLPKPGEGEAPPLAKGPDKGAPDKSAPDKGAPIPPLARGNGDEGPDYTNPDGGPTTRGSGRLAGGPATRPSEADAVAQLQQAENQFGVASKKPLLEQPIGDLIASYQKIAETPEISENTRRMADVRLSTLKLRSEAREQFLAVQKQQQKLQERLQVQTAEKEEIQERLRQTDIQVYAAVGTLRTSSLQVGRTTLYRLTDPTTGRTVVYVRSADPKFAEMLGQFVGVKGKLDSEAQLNLKVVTPTATDVVDPAKLNTSVAAEIVPPSMLPRAASTNQ
jgi:uncharacterized protein YgiM (DUF1202 family)